MNHMAVEYFFGVSIYGAFGLVAWKYNNIVIKLVLEALQTLFVKRIKGNNEESRKLKQ